MLDIGIVLIGISYFAALNRRLHRHKDNGASVIMRLPESMATLAGALLLAIHFGFR